MINKMIALSREAQEVYRTYSLEEVDDLVAKLCDEGYKNADVLARLVVTETGMGVYEHKVLKNQLATKSVYNEIKNVKSVGVVREDKKNGMTEIAYPYGIVFSICPTTNPTATALHNIIIALKGGNSIILSPHPKAVKSTMKVVEILREVLTKNNVDENLIQCIEEPTLKTTQKFMQDPLIDLIIATGGSGLVSQAYSSGTPAYGVGPGNGPVYIDKSAKLDDAARKLTLSKSFDNGVLCSTESSAVVHKNVYQLFLRNLKNNGCYVLSDEEKLKVENVIFDKNSKLNLNIIGKSAVEIAEMAHVIVPANTIVLAAEEVEVGKDVAFAIEKLSPLLGIYRVNSLTEAMKICDDLLSLGGRGHTCSIHAQDDSVIETYSLHMPVSRCVVNSYASIGAAGATTNLIPSLTLGCGSYGKNITSDNITVEHLINIKRIARHQDKQVEIPRVHQLSNKNIQDSPINNVSQKSLEDYNYQDIKKIVSQVIKETSSK